MRRYQISPAARQDLREIYLYIARDNRAAAGRMMRTFEDRFSLLITQPMMGEARPDLGDDLRINSVANYAIVFRAAGDDLEIVRVLHGARDIEAMF